jgi:hypothetical protein
MSGKRPNGVSVTVVTGPIGSGKKSLLEAIRLAANGTFDIECAVIGSDSAYGNLGVIHAREETLADAVRDYVNTLVASRERSFHLLVSGNLEQGQVGPLLRRDLNARLVCIKCDLEQSFTGVAHQLCDGHHPVSDINQVYEMWQRHQKGALPAISKFSLTNRILWLERKIRFGNRVAELIRFMDVREGVKSKLLHNATRDREHAAYKFIKEVERKKDPSIVFGKGGESIPVSTDDFPLQLHRLYNSTGSVV